MKQVHLLAIAGIAFSVILNPGTVTAQKDPGPRPVTAAGPQSLPGLPSDLQSFFTDAMSSFMEIDSVSGSISGESGTGLGPTFNGNSCAQCHAFPVIGGSSPASNPQVQLANLDGALNTVPSFITSNGPVREARFVRNSDGTPDGGVHGLFSIRGRTDAEGCGLTQPNFAQQLAAGNVIFRIPTPTFGLGLVEATPDSTLQANLAANQSVKSQLGINGVLNTSGNDGTVTRFGWKAQNKSLMVFAGEAYNVEQGVSNEEFVNERAAVAGCVYNGSPEDATNVIDEAGSPTGSAAQMSSDVVNFAAFMRLSSAPTPGPMSASATNGASLFNSVGCALCHTATLTTGMSKFTGMSNVTYHPYSDFALHHMGSRLADGISQGAADGDQFRTAPLWGIGQRLFFLHDGRTSDLLQAIQAHASTDCVDSRFRSRSFASQNCGSEANAVVRRFNSLNRSQMQDVLNFLRSL
ncbi:MAG: di-heme oxidoredictase family protein [Terriglobales bacterium]